MDLKFTGERLVPGKFEKTSQLYVEHITRYEFAVSFVKDRNILDAGCGCGYGSNLLAQHARNVTGIDISAEAIAYCNHEYKRHNLNFHQMDCCQMVFGDTTFETVISFEFIEHLKDPSIFLQEVNRILKSDGVFVVSTPNNDRFADLNNPFHLFNMGSREFKQILTHHFDKVEFFGQKINPIFLLNKKIYFLQKELVGVNEKLNNLLYFFLKSLIPAPIKENLKKCLKNNRFSDKNNINSVKISRDYPMNLTDISIELNNLDNVDYIIGVCGKTTNK